MIEFVPKFGFFVITPCKGSPHTLTIGGRAVWRTREEAETALGLSKIPLSHTVREEVGHAPAQHAGRRYSKVRERTRKDN